MVVLKIIVSINGVSCQSYVRYDTIFAAC